MSGGDWEEEAERRYKIVRSGDHLIKNFYYDKCHFRNNQGRDPNSLADKYMRLMDAIRRETLDDFWSREPGTIKGNFTMVKRLRKVAREEMELD